MMAVCVSAIWEELNELIGKRQRPGITPSAVCAFGCGSLFMHGGTGAMCRCDAGTVQVSPSAQVAMEIHIARHQKTESVLSCETLQHTAVRTVRAIHDRLQLCSTAQLFQWH